MLSGAYQGAAAMGGLQQWQELISHNLAAASVPGYKKSALSFETVAAGEMGSSQRAYPVAKVTTSFEAGAIRPTGNPTDLALRGEGFFVLRRPDGSQMYTRDGEFHVGADGQLASKQGYAVEGEGGPITLTPGLGPVSVSETGEVFQGSTAVGRLSLMKFDEPEALQRVSGGFVEENERGRSLAQPAEEVEVASGFLENANVSPLTEMVHLIQVSNAFEANQRVIRNYDSLSSEVVRTLGSTS